MSWCQISRWWQIVRLLEDQKVRISKCQCQIVLGIKMSSVNEHYGNTWRIEKLKVTDLGKFPVSPNRTLNHQIVFVWRCSSRGAWPFCFEENPVPWNPLGFTTVFQGSLVVKFGTYPLSWVINHKDMAEGGW